MQSTQYVREISDKPTRDPEFARDLIDWLVNAGYTWMGECEISIHPGSPLKICSETAEVRLKLTRIK